jgi:hypothetical protein
MPLTIRQYGVGCAPSYFPFRVLDSFLPGADPMSLRPSKISRRHPRTRGLLRWSRALPPIPFLPSPIAEPAADVREEVMCARVVLELIETECDVESDVRRAHRTLAQ